MSLSREDVVHVASLARLGMTDDEIDMMQDQLSSILGHIEELNELDTGAIPPTAQVLEMKNVLREDEVRDSLPQETVMRMTPAAHDGFIAVSEVLGGGEEGPSA